MKIEDLLPVDCDLSFMHVTKTDIDGKHIDALHGKRGERPNYFLQVDNNLGSLDYSTTIPEKLRKKDFYKFMEE